MSSYDKRRCYSAGILPYTIRDNTIYYLLGRDWRDEGWSDFGGKVEDKDSNNIIKTAIREFYEETMGCVMTYTDLVKNIDADTKSIRSVTLNGSPYYMYFMYVSDEDYHLYFHKIHEFLTHSKISDPRFLEKCDVMWISSQHMTTPQGTFKLRNIFSRTLHRCKEHIKIIEKEILKEYALKV